MFRFFKKFKSLLFLPLTMVAVFIVSATFIPQGAVAQIYNSSNTNGAVSNAAPQTGTAPAQNQTPNASIEQKLNCGITDIGGCLLWALLSFVKWLIWFLLVPFFAFLARISASVLDLSINFSFETLRFLANSEAVNSIWGLTRDLVNVAFIFGLLWAAIATILQIGGHNLKSFVVKIVIAALLINFSLFFTKVIIDASNLVSVSLYNQFQNVVYEVAKQTGGADFINSTATNPGGGTTPNMPTLGQALGYATRVQVFLNQDKNATSTPDLASEYVNSYMIGLIMIILLAILMWALWSGAVLMLYRSVYLVVLMAFSPIGFLFGAVPKLTTYASQWWGKLTDALIAGPVFAFMLLLFAKILSINELFKGLQTSLDGDVTQNYATIAANFFNFAFVIAMFIICVRTTKKVSGAVGSFGSEWAGKALGFAGGLALGGAAGALRLGVGGAATRLMDSKIGEKLKDSAAKGGVAGVASRLALRTTEGASKSSFDVRNTSAGKTVLRQASQLDSSLSFGTGGGAGGYKKQLDERTEREQKYAESLGYDRKKMYDAQTRLKGFQDDLTRAKRTGAAPAVVAAVQRNIDATKEEIENIKNARQNAYAASLRRSDAPAGAVVGGLAGAAVAGPVGAVAGAAVGAAVAPVAAAITGRRAGNHRAAARLEVKAKEETLKRLEDVLKKKKEALDKVSAEITRLKQKQQSGVEVNGVWYERDANGQANMSKKALSQKEEDLLVENEGGTNGAGTAVVGKKTKLEQGDPAVAGDRGVIQLEGEKSALDAEIAQLKQRHNL